MGLRRVQQVSYWCDEEGCGDYYNTAPGTKEEVKAFLIQHGWQFISKRNYCPKHHKRRWQRTR